MTVSTYADPYSYHSDTRPLCCCMLVEKPTQRSPASSGGNLDLKALPHLGIVRSRSQTVDDVTDTNSKTNQEPPHPFNYCLISLFHLTNRYAALSQKHTLADISADARIFVGTSRGMCMIQTHNLACHLAPVSHGPCSQCAF